jgi:hypothetical protein
MHIVSFGALLGATGQAIRVIPGLKKLHEAAHLTQQPMQDLFSASKLSVSLLIGAIAGVLGALTLSLDLAKPVSAQVLVSLIGIGYAGTDFIESFMAPRFSPKAPAAAPPAAAGSEASLVTKPVG